MDWRGGGDDGRNSGRWQAALGYSMEAQFGSNPSNLSATIEDEEYRLSGVFGRLGTMDMDELLSQQRNPVLKPPSAPEIIATNASGNEEHLVGFIDTKAVAERPRGPDRRRPSPKVTAKNLDRESIDREMGIVNKTKTDLQLLGMLMEGQRRMFRNRKYHLKTYKNVAVGSQLVDLMVKEGWCRTREEAVEAGRRLVKAELLIHATSEHGFEDKYLFYNHAGPQHIFDRLLQEKQYQKRLPMRGFRDFQRKLRQDAKPMSFRQAVSPSENAHLLSPREAEDGTVVGPVCLVGGGTVARMGPDFGDGISFASSNRKTVRYDAKVLKKGLAELAFKLAAGDDINLTEALVEKKKTVDVSAALERDLHAVEGAETSGGGAVEIVEAEVEVLDSDSDDDSKGDGLRRAQSSLVDLLEDGYNETWEGLMHVSDSMMELLESGWGQDSGTIHKAVDRLRKEAKELQDYVDEMLVASNATITLETGPA